MGTQVGWAEREAVRMRPGKSLGWREPQRLPESGSERAWGIEGGWVEGEAMASSWRGLC